MALSVDGGANTGLVASVDSRQCLDTWYATGAEAHEAFRVGAKRVGSMQQSVLRTEWGRGEAKNCQLAKGGSSDAYYADRNSAWHRN